MKRIFLSLAILLYCQLFHAATLAPEKANPSDIRIVPVRPTPEPDNVQTTIQFPNPRQVVYQTPVNVQVRLLGYPVGIESNFARRKQIYNDPMGQSLLVFIDNHHPIEIYKSFIDALSDSNIFYDLTLTTQIPFNLSEGMHVIRTFPDRSYGESLKSPGSYSASIFYFREEKNNLDVDLKAPYLTYNEPLETMAYSSEKPLLLDFYLSNIQLSKDGYKVRVTIDNSPPRLLTMWVPYYIYGLSKGKHRVRLELLNEKNEVAPGLFNDVERIVTID